MRNAYQAHIFMTLQSQAQFKQIKLHEDVNWKFLSRDLLITICKADGQINRNWYLKILTFIIKFTILEAIMLCKQYYSKCKFDTMTHKYLNGKRTLQKVLNMATS